MSNPNIDINVSGTVQPSSQYKTVVLKSNLPLAQQLTKPNTKYVVKHDFDLGDGSVTIPTGCLIEFDGGSISDGTITGNDTIVSFNNPFIGNNCTVIGCKTDRKLNKDVDIFISVQHTQTEIEQLFSFSRKGVKTVFSKGEYNDISEIQIAQDIDADFSGGVIHVADYGDKVNKNLMMMPYADEAEEFTLDSFCLRSVEIVGSGDNYFLVEYIDEQGHKPQYSHPYIPCIQLFNVRNIVFDNVDINNYIGGAKNYSSVTDLRYRWMVHIVSCYWYEKCSINNCKLSWNVFEGYMFVPKTIKSNITTITDCYVHDYYYTPFFVSDGKIVFQRNIIDRGACTMAHLHSYDAEVSYNTFKNGANSTHTYLALEENGSHYATNFNIHHNYLEGDFTGIRFTGSDISIHDNVYDGTNIFCASKNYNSTLESAHNSLDRIPEDGRNKNVNVFNNKINGIGCVLGRSIDNLFVFNNISKHVDITARGIQIECYNCKNITIVGNTFSKTGTNSKSSAIKIPIMFFGDDCGKIEISENHFINGYIDALYSGDLTQGHSIAADYIIVTDNFSETNVSLSEGINNVSIIPIYFKNNRNIKFKAVTDKTLYGDDIREVVDTSPLNGMYFIKGQSSYIGDIKIICVREGIYANERSGNTFTRRGTLFSPSDGSVCVAINEGKTAVSEPDYTSIDVDETITDGALTVKKLATNTAVFKCDTGVIYPANATIPAKYLQEGVQKLGANSEVLHWNGTAWVDATGTPV